MPLAPGTRLGLYEVVEPLGAGGMGEVYRARDTQLKRDVALKILPGLFAGLPDAPAGSGSPLARLGADRLARFQREAEVLAALNHRHIAQIYGLADAEGVRALVMELVEGETLADRLTRGPLPVDEALPLARQLAEALEFAHERGVVHRDLKPANVKLTADGAIKVLDFGLAKAIEKAPLAPALADSPTVTSPALTGEGVILGTAAYMAPEQARGLAVDRRVDIWAFGAVLFEMLSGRRCFEGETVSDLIAAVLRGEPKWDALPPAVPPRVRDLLRRCLVKDPQRRLRDIGDARVQLEEVLAEPVISMSQTPVPPRRSIAWRLAAPWMIAGLASLVAALAVFDRASRPPATSGGVVKVTMALPAPLDLEERSPIALSSDGRRFVFVGRHEGRTRLFVQDLTSFETRALAGTEGGLLPFFSPDGEWLGFFTSTHLKKVSLRGGAPVALCEVPPVARGAAWGADGRIVFVASTSGGLMRVGAAGGTPEVLTTLDRESGETAHMWPEVLPGAKAVVFTARTGDTFDAARLIAQSLETGERRVVVEGGTYPRYASTGHLLFERAGAMMAVSFDPVSLRAGSAPVPVLDGVRLDPRFGSGFFAVSATGTLVYIPGDASGATNRVVTVDRAGVERPLVDDRRAHMMPSVSPDGRQLAVAVGAANQDLWLAEIARGTLSRLTFDATEEFGPTWTSDGRRLVYVCIDIGGEPDLRVRAADGSGKPEVLLEPGQQARLSPVMAPDGGSLAFVEQGISEVNSDIWVLPLAGDRRPQPFAQTPFFEYAPAFSPDGRYLAYVSNESGRREVYVRTFPQSGAKRQVSVEGGTSPVWARDGRELFFRRGDAMMAVEVRLSPEFAASTPKVLFRGEYEEAGRPDWPRNYDVMPDGRSFVMIKPDATRPTADVRLVLNWFDELKK